jgi:hypothetical protein
MKRKFVNKKKFFSEYEKLGVEFDKNKAESEWVYLIFGCKSPKQISDSAYRVWNELC